ncbi:thiamine phosphate synthase [soil metagenome]
MTLGRLHVLTDFLFQQRYSHAQLAEFAIRGGADVIQFRQKDGDARHRLYELEGVAQAASERGVCVIVNDDPSLALSVGADGVHLGQTDLPIPMARRILGDDCIIGATVTSADQARKAQYEGANYVGFGPVFATASKRSPAKVKGLAGLEETCKAVSIPVIAIAGLTPERVSSVMEAGAYGIAVMTAISTRPNPEAATRRFAEALGIG